MCKWCYQGIILIVTPFESDVHQNLILIATLFESYVQQNLDGLKILILFLSISWHNHNPHILNLYQCEALFSILCRQTCDFSIKVKLCFWWVISYMLLPYQDKGYSCYFISIQLIGLCLNELFTNGLVQQWWGIFSHPSTWLLQNLSVMTSDWACGMSSLQTNPNTHFIQYGQSRIVMCHY